MTRALSFPIRDGRAALLLVAVACFSPGRASAECGDYVTILNAPANHPHAAPQPEHHPATEPPAPVKPPCHGPNCSGAPNRELPPLAPVATTAPAVKDLARLLGPIDPDSHVRGRFERDHSSPRPVRRPSDVFHPPRHG